MKTLINLFFLFSILFSYSQKEVFDKGKIIDSVLINGNSGESFALYIPNNYDVSAQTPIVFIFDPAARGKTGIYPFVMASEKYCYLLVCSNDSKNGPYQTNYDIANRLFEEVFRKFNIDENRIYTAGFSGGSRLAANIALLSGSIQGVIACGAGFTSKLNLVGTEISFSYAAIIGDEDMNYLEMLDTKEYLNKMNISNELFIYEINHRWPSQDQILRAFDYLQLEAIKKQIILKNEQNLKSIYNDFFAYASQLEKDKKELLTLDEYERILRNFDRIFDVDSIRSKTIELKNYNSVKKQQKELKSIYENERYLTERYTKRFYNDLEQKNKNLKWWNSEITKLHKKIEKADSNEKKMLNRLLYKIFAMAIEAPKKGNYKNISEAIFCYDLCIFIYPKYSRPYFEQIKNFIQSNDKDMALKYLEKLINTGYDNYSSIEENKAFESLRNTDRYKELIIER